MSVRERSLHSAQQNHHFQRQALPAATAAAWPGTLSRLQLCRQGIGDAGLLTCAVTEEDIVTYSDIVCNIVM